jgi:hemolysin D
MKSFLSVRPTSPDPNAVARPGREIRIFESETAEILEGPDPRQARITLFAVSGLLVSLILVALCMRVDRVVSSSAGQIVTVEPTIVLGALDQSIIKTLQVREGERVTKGQVLATLDPTFTTADVGALRAQITSLNAQIARCEAELAQKPFEMVAPNDPASAPYVALQRAYYQQRKGQFDAQLRSYNEQMAQYKATMVKFQNDQARYADRAKISKEIEDMRATLAAAQVGSRLNLLVATDQKLEIERTLEFDRNAVLESQHQLDSTTATRDAFVQQWYGQVSDELVKAQNSRDSAKEQLSKAEKHADLVQLEAPEDGMVLKLAKLSVHSVLNQGDPLIHLAPLKSPLEAELHVQARDVGFIRAGDRVTVKLAPFDFVEHGTASGQVRSISEGTFTADDNGQAVDPYYKVRVALTNVDLQRVPQGFRLVPGMTLTGDIHIGTRSLFAYLAGGIARGFDQAMREP